MSNSYIAMSYKCNHDCICCPLSTFDRLHAPLNFDVLKSQINEMSKEGRDLSFTISGGEPTINENFLDLINLLSTINANIVVLSNASSCADKEYVARLLASIHEDYDLAKLRYVTAIHSIDSKLHDGITRVNGSLNESLTGIENLSSNGVNVTIKHIMNKYTCASMCDTFTSLSNFFPTTVSYQFCSMDYTGRCKKHISQLYADFAYIAPYLERTIDSYETNPRDVGRGLSIFETPLCMVDPYYWRYFEEHRHILGSYIAPNDESIDNKSEQVESECNTNYKECSNCDVREFCGGVWKSAYQIGSRQSKEFLKPVKALKKIY